MGIRAPLVITRIQSQPEFQKHRAQINAELAARQEAERELAQPFPSFTTSGFCFVCQKRTQFLSVWALSYYSQEYSYLGDKQIQFLAEK